MNTAQALQPERETLPFVQEVADFLDMWSCIENGFKAMAAPDQEAFRADRWLTPPVFQGFDGKSEGEYLGAARFMIEHLGCFPNFAGRDLESHHPVVEPYRQILEAFRPVWARIEENRPLTVHELKAVLS